MDEQFKNCIKGSHKWRTIQGVRIGSNIDEVVRWCNVCGCIVVDQESDGRLLGQSLSITGAKVYNLYRAADSKLNAKNASS